MSQVEVAHTLQLPHGRQLFRVAALSSLPSEWVPDLSFLIRCVTLDDVDTVQRLRTAGLENIFALVSSPALANKNARLANVCDNSALLFGDVVALNSRTSIAQVLFRSTDDHHTVFLTGRCDNYCVMCSQPPKSVNDDWLAEEAIALSRNIPGDPSVIGFSGGEPLLLGRRLHEVLESYLGEHPSTLLEVLTNGRRLADRALAESLLTSRDGRISWMVPLYGHADFLHDFVVQQHGAFEDTLSGILNLQEFQQPIQLRVVLIKPVLNEIEEICRFVSVNLPFVRSMAFMGCEPIGFALANREVCDVNLVEYLPALMRSIRTVERVGITPVIMNIPQCKLLSDMHPYAAKSISNWKRAYGEACSGCDANSSCGGYFVWQPNHWRRMQPDPIRKHRE